MIQEPDANVDSEHHTDFRDISNLPSEPLECVTNLYEENVMTTAQSVASEFATLRESMLFFFSAIGCTIGWTSVLSNLVFYSETLGMSSFMFLNFAVFTPLLPITLAQAIWDARFDRRFNSLRSFSFRGTVGFFTTLVCVLVLPRASHSLLHLTLTTVFLGLSSAILHGTLKQMASFVYPRCRRSSAAVTAGMQASGLLVLLVSIYSGFGRCSNQQGIMSFYTSIAGLVLVCWCSFYALLYCSEGIIKSMSRRDSQIIISELDEPLLSSNDDQDVGHLPETSEIQELSFLQLWSASWPVCFAVLITIASSMSVASLFNRVQSQNPDDTGFPQVLFYARLVADLIGRPATLCAAPKSVLSLIVVSVLRLGFVPIFVAFISTNWFPRNDLVVLLGVVAFAFSSGYLVTLSYQIAPVLLSDHVREQNVMKQANLINVCFSASAILGLVASAILSTVLP